MRPDGPTRVRSRRTRGRWRLLAIVAVGTLLAMAPWFSASAVAPLLIADWSLDSLGLPTLAIAVQLGFAVGAFSLALTAAADVLPARVLFAGGAFLAAVANLGFAFVARDAGSALPFRVLTGLALAGVYPIGLKLLAGWFRRERGLAIGVLVGALTVGSALPYLLRAVGASNGLDWHATVGAASVVGDRGRRPRPVGRIQWPVGRPGAALQPRRREVRLPRARGPPGQPWLPGPHVGALRDVDLGAAVPGRQLHGGRDGESDDREPRGVRDRRVGRRRAASWRASSRIASDERP